MIYLTGDTHKDLDIAKLFDENTSHLTKDDYLIILGDFGLPFLDSDVGLAPASNKMERKEREIYRTIMKQIAALPYTILFVDGNHDNHPFWQSQKVIEMFGGKVHKHPDSPNVFHLMRGEYYTIEGHTFFSMGGAVSADKAYRKPGYTWWPGEIASQAEMEQGIQNLLDHHDKVDYILSHEMPYELIRYVLRKDYPRNDMSAYLDLIQRNIAYQYWFCGHHHVDTNLPTFKIQVLYNSVVCLKDYAS